MASLTEGNKTTEKDEVIVRIAGDNDELANVEVDHEGTGKLKTKSHMVGHLMSTYVPDPSDYDTGTDEEIKIDSDQNLVCRSVTHVDEGSFRHTFAVTSIQNITGTCSFTNGSLTVTGSGTAFTTELTTQMYLRLSTDAITKALKIASIDSDTELTLDSAYDGTTSSGTGTRSQFYLDFSGTSANISIVSSEVAITSGTDNGGYALAYKHADYLPLIGYCDLDISQRIANQETIFGFVNDPSPGATVESQAVVVFSGTSNNTVIFRTSRESGYLQQTTITLPGSRKTSNHLDYEINVLPEKCVLIIDSKIVATHTDSIPGPYDVLYLTAYMTNAAAVTATTLSISSLYLANYNVIQVANSFTGAPLRVQVVASPDTRLRGFIDGIASTASTSVTTVRSTTYTEQTTNAQRSIKSSSANDTSAGTGARTVKITYYDQDMTGPYTETVTLNGTTAVATTATDICYIERLDVITAGSGGTSAGTISLYANNAGTGTVIWSISAGTTKTYGCHHYVASGYTCKITSASFCTSGTVAGNGGIFWLTYQDKSTASSVIQQLSDTLSVPGITPQTTRTYGTPLEVVGPAVIVGYCKPASGSSYNNFFSFDYYEE